MTAIYFLVVYVHSYLKLKSPRAFSGEKRRYSSLFSYFLPNIYIYMRRELVLQSQNQMNIKKAVSEFVYAEENLHESLLFFVSSKRNPKF